MLKTNKMKFIMLVLLCTFFMVSLTYKPLHAQDSGTTETAGDVAEDDTPASVGVAKTFRAIDLKEIPSRDKFSRTFDAEKFRQSTQKIPLGAEIRPAEKIDFSKRLKETSKQQGSLGKAIKPEERANFSRRLKETSKQQVPSAVEIRPEEKANFGKRLKEVNEQERMRQKRIRSEIKQGVEGNSEAN